MARTATSFIEPVSGPFVAIDFETADHYADSACAVGLVRVENGRVVRRVRQLIRPPRDIMLFTHIHGITLDAVEDKPEFGQAWPVLREILDGAKFIAAHNAGFDRGVLFACCDSAGLERPTLPWVCSVRQARRVLNIFPANLANVCRVMGLKLNHHEALSDAEACARIVMASRRAQKTSRGQNAPAT
ncbi:MAG: 3'-5' exonuclease [Planctomycetes bacterium]|nr:3'-5' exonuclease [Planctomycetota bacterium]